MKRIISEEIFNIQTRLFRQFQLEEEISAEAAEKIFKEYEVFDYIKICYEEYHVQGDDTNLKDIYKYLEGKGWQK